MKKLLFLVVCLIAFGIYRGWFAVTDAPATPGSTKENFELTIDRDRIKADAAALEQRAGEIATKAQNAKQ